MPGGIVSHPAVRDRIPDFDDWGIVARVIGGGGFIITDQIRPSIATRTAIPQGVAAVVFMAANVNRRGASFFNDSSAFLYIAHGAGATLASYTVRISPKGFWEVEWPTYTGIITGLWGAAGGGTCQVTELT